MRYPADGLSLARAGIKIQFEGRGAHAGVRIWRVSWIRLIRRLRHGPVSMLLMPLCKAVSDTFPLIPTIAEVTDVAVSTLRQQLEPNMRVHGIITGGDTWAQVGYSLRSHLFELTCIEYHSQMHVYNRLFAAALMHRRGCVVFRTSHQCQADS